MPTTYFNTKELRAISKSDISTHRSALIRPVLRWYSRCGRSLPWRDITNPYRILLSEVMLQQTQVSRVLEKYPEFLRRFPTISILAAARQRDVVVAWRGMGYNNRAIRLHQLARAIVHCRRGRFPGTYDQLLELPGVGRYTANAILSSAFRQDVPIVDVNIRRLLSRIFWRMGSTSDMKPDGAIWELAAAILPRGKTYDWNQALMDIGATICTARAPKCNDCPVTRLCASRGSMRRVVLRSSRKEPSLDGIPNRIYRGRIIETLRSDLGRRKLTTGMLARTIYPPYSAAHRGWLESLLAGLERDRLIKRSRAKQWNSRRVALA